MQPRRVVIVDDEPPARRRLAQLLAAHDDFAIVGQASTTREAATMIDAASPDLLLLDVQLAAETSFSLFSLVSVKCAVIFVTAHAQFALPAFEVRALDYVLKPVEPARFAEALARVRERETDVVTLRTSRGFRVVSLREIVAIRACDDYTEVVLTSAERALSDLRMSDWEQRSGSALVRVHRSWIVRASRIERFERRSNGWAIAVQGFDEPVPVGRLYVRGVRARLFENL